MDNEVEHNLDIVNQVVLELARVLLSSVQRQLSRMSPPRWSVPTAQPDAEWLNDSSHEVAILKSMLYSDFILQIY
jgi:hypothetical protein